MQRKPRVLVVDDEQPLATVVASYLEAADFDVRLAFDGPSAISAASEMQPDLIVLDLMLPGANGIEVCRRVREFSDCYIVMLTARDEESDKILGLTVGADDYVVKPFSPRELVARIHALLRRPRESGLGAGSRTPTVVVLRDLTLEPLARTTAIANRRVELTQTEFDLLATMCTEPRRVFSRRELISNVWGERWFGDEHLVDVHIRNLRRKLGDDASEPTWIRTVRGVGYGMVS